MNRFLPFTLALIFFLCAFGLFSVARAGFDSGASIGKIQRKVECYEVGEFRVCQGPGTFYPAFSKAIHTEMFGQAVTISYVPVFADGDGREYFDDGAYEAPVTEGYTLKTVDVLFDFGEGKVFVLPLHVESEPGVGDGFEDIAEFFPMTDCFGAYSAKRLGEEKGKETETQYSAGDFEDIKVFKDVDVYSPFHPFSLAVMRHFINHPEQGKVVFDAVEHIQVKEMTSMKAKSFPVRVHNKKNYVNLAAFQPPEKVSGEPYPDTYKPSETYYTGSLEVNDSEGAVVIKKNKWSYRGTHFFEYQGNSLIQPSVVEVSEQIHGLDDRELQTYQYGLDIGDVKLKSAGEKYIRARMIHIIAMAEAQREQLEPAPKAGAGLKRKRWGGSPVPVSKRRKLEGGQPYGRNLEAMGKTAMTADEELPGWSDTIQRRVKLVMKGLEKSEGVIIKSRSWMRTEMGDNELMHPMVAGSRAKK